MISKRKRGVVALLAAITLLTCNAISISAYAAEIPAEPNSITVQAAVPNNTPQEYKNATGKSNKNGSADSIDASDVLGDGKIGKDDTGYAEEVNSYGQVVVKFIVNLAVYLFATMLLIMFAIDCLCIPFPPFAKFFATKVPIQLFSNEVATITGIQFSHSKGGGGAGAPPPPPSNGGGANGQEGIGAKYITYFKNRAVALIFSGTLLVMTYSGLLSRLLNKAINIIIGLFNK